MQTRNEHEAAYCLVVRWGLDATQGKAKVVLAPALAVSLAAFKKSTFYHETQLIMPPCYVALSFSRSPLYPGTSSRLRTLSADGRSAVGALVPADMLKMHNQHVMHVVAESNFMEGITVRHQGPSSTSH